MTDHNRDSAFQEWKGGLKCDKNCSHIPQLTEADQDPELPKSELEKEEEFYSAYYLDLFLNSAKNCPNYAALLQAALADNSKLKEQNSSLWKIIFTLLRSDKKT